MRIERSKNAVRNIKVGFLLRIYRIVVPFIVRTLMIQFLGVEYLGLNSLFVSILQVLNLTELGVGDAMVYAMYKPIVEDDTKRICGLLYLYRKYYLIIGCVIAAVGGILTPFVPYLISGTVPDGTNIYVLYLLNLGSTVFTYWFGAYRISLFNAHQRNDVFNRINIITSTIQYALQIAAIVVWKNYYLYVAASIGSQILYNLICARSAKRSYPEYNPENSLDQGAVHAINRRIRDLFTTKVAYVITNSADTIVISAFMGLTVLAIYQNYFYILSSIMAFLTIIFQGITAGIGNSLLTETMEKNYGDLKKVTFMIVWLAGFCTCCLLCLYQPFMEVWVGKDLMFSDSIMVLFCVYFYVLEINSILETYRDAAGLWSIDKARPLVTALSNLALNLLFVNTLKIYGVILSTVVTTLFIGTPWLLHNVFHAVFRGYSARQYALRLLRYSCAVAGLSILCYVLCSLFPVGGIWQIVINLVVCVMVFNLLFGAIYKRTTEYAYVRSEVQGRLKRFQKE